MIRANPLFLLLLLGLGAGTVLYAPLLDGYWLGDDLSNLWGAHRWAEDGNWTGLLETQFFSGVSEGGGFFRPLIIVSMNLNYLAAGTNYAGWFSVNLLVHLFNGLLIYAVVRRLREIGCVTQTSPWPALYAAVSFTLCPFLAEGVYWVSARSDQWVSFFSLLGFWFWIGWSSGDSPVTGARWLPVILLPALLFKESATILPMQIGLFWLAVPSLRDRPRLNSLLVCCALVMFFFLWRFWLFGDAFTVYDRKTNAGDTGVMAQLITSFTSLWPWMQGLLGEQFSLGGAYLIAGQMLLLAISLMQRCLSGSAPGLSIAASCAAGGLLLATFLNLGGLAASGEGGRLLYSPLTWFFLASGVTLWLPENPRAMPWATKFAGVVVLVSIVCLSSWLLHGLVRQVFSVQSTIRQIVEAVPGLIEQQSGKGRGVLLIADHVGPIVAFRNGQGAVVSPPLQEVDSLDHMVPTLSHDLALIRARFPPQWVACWSGQESRLKTFWTPPQREVEAARWPSFIQMAARSAGCEPI